MNKLSIGKVRGLEQISTADGILVICAMDHRESLKAMLDEEAPEAISYEEMVKHKMELCQALAPHASAVLLDPNYGAAQCITSGVLPGHTGLMVSVEATGYKKSKEERITTLLENWGVGKIKRLGASAVKILIYYRPDLTSAATKQLATVERVARECIRYDIPFLVEPKAYPIREEKGEARRFAIKKTDLVIETAQQVTGLPIDVLKAEFPADLHYEKDEKRLLEMCHRLNEASQVPWVILSAGVDYEVFAKEVEIACRAGASGFLGGRAIWQEALHIEESSQRVKYLETTVVDRLKRLADIATKYATPWYRKLGLQREELASVPKNWYETYRKI